MSVKIACYKQHPKHYNIIIYGLIILLLLLTFGITTVVIFILLLPPHIIDLSRKSVQECISDSRRMEDTPLARIVLHIPTLIIRIFRLDADDGGEPIFQQYNRRF